MSMKASKIQVMMCHNHGTQTYLDNNKGEMYCFDRNFKKETDVVQVWIFATSRTYPSLGKQREVLLSTPHYIQHTPSHCYVGKTQDFHNTNTTTPIGGAGTLTVTYHCSWRRLLGYSSICFWCTTHINIFNQNMPLATAWRGAGLPHIKNVHEGV